MKRDYSKRTLLKFGYENHGSGELYGYGENGFAGAWLIRTSYDLASLPADLRYAWAN